MKRAQKSVSVLVVAVLVMALGLTFTGTAAAAGTMLFDQTFKNNTANGTGSVVLPATSTGVANAACLTAAGGTTAPLKTCPAGVNTDANGSGALSLSPATTNKVGGVFAATSVPTSQGLDVTFTINQYGGGGADGVAFALAAVDPTTPTAPANIGPTGGALGYTAFSTTAGLAHAYLGFGFDVYGNFSSSGYQGSGCTATNSDLNLVKNGTTPGQVLVRGPGNGTVGYCPLVGTGTTTSSGAAQAVVPLRGTTRATSSVPVQIVINSGTAGVTTSTGLTVAAESYLVAFTPVGGSQRTLTKRLPAMAPALVSASSWLDADGLPKQLAFGWVGSTGSVTDNHEITNVKVSSLGTVSQLAVSQVNYTPAAASTTTTLPNGSPISYVVSPSVSAGVSENGVVSVTETVPVGVTPLAASGTGWVCGAPSGQTIKCTNSGGPFAAGSSLPTVTVSAVVTGPTTGGGGVTQAVVQTSSVVTASSDTGLAGYSTTSSTGTNPATPTITALSPTSGSTAGGTAVTISGTNLTGVTSIRVGTDSELAGSGGTTLLKCAGAAAAGCFTVSGSTLVISSMPGHAAGAVTVKVINLGASGTGTYTYTSVPGTPVVTATAGITSATVTWSAPATGGSPITGYTVLGYLNGQAQAALSRSPAATVTTLTYTGLTAGGSYTFAVIANNANGSGTAGSSTAVVPYTVPGAPLSPSAVASSGQAVVSWAAPSSDGSSPITGYIVTPYLGTVAQTAQSFATADLSQTVTGLTPGGTYSFSVKAVNAAGTGAESAKTGTVTINALPTLALPTPVAGEVGAAYTNPAFSATGGTGPFSWTIDSGALPAGISLTTAGVLSGTPTTAGTATFTVKVTDSAAKTATQALTLTVAAAPVLDNPAPPVGQVGVAYSNQLVVKAGTGTGPFTWAVTTGSLPAGLTLGASTGLLAGTPTAAGNSSFTVRATDAQDQSASQALTITVTASPSLSFPAPPGGQVGAAYTDQLVVTGGTGPFTWSTTGSLPPGLTLNASTGLLSGTPTAAGTYPFTVRVQDSKGQNASQAVSVTIAASPTLTFTPAAGEVGVAYTAQPALVGGTGPFTYSISAGTLPAGLSINATTGTIGGTPTGPTSAAITVRVTDSFGQSATANGTIVITAAPSLNLPAPPSGDQGTAYDLQLTVTGGTAPFAWDIAGGTLPSGLTLDPATGGISGTPTAGGTFAFTVRVTDGFGLSATQQLTILIRASSTVAVQTSVSSISPGGAVTVTATVGPGSPTGTVTFTDSISSGPAAGTSAILGSVPVGSDGTASLSVTLSEFGAHNIVASYGGDTTHTPAASAPATVQVTGTVGSLIVSEFRLSGPGGSGDQYVELTNVGPNPLALSGFQLISSSGVTTTLPTGSPVLDTNRSYLIAGPSYSLGSTAQADLVRAADLGSGGIKVVVPDTAQTVSDAVGPNDPGFFLGTPLPAFTGTPADQFAWVRTQQRSYLLNTGDNAADFALVSTSGGVVGGVQSMLGSPSPTSLTSPWQHTFVVISALADPSLSASVQPNRVAVRVKPGVPGSLQVRRTLTNTTTETVTAMKLRINSLSEANGLAPVVPVTGPKANLRVINPVAPSSTITVAGAPVTVLNLGVDGPATANPGGGLNSTLTVPLPSGGLAPGASVTVAITFAADTGGTFWFGYDVDTLGLG